MTGFMTPIKDFEEKVVSQRSNVSSPKSPTVMVGAYDENNYVVASTKTLENV
jgi:hypothetical protein